MPKICGGVNCNAKNQCEALLHDWQETLSPLTAPDLIMTLYYRSRELYWGPLQCQELVVKPITVARTSGGAYYNAERRCEDILQDWQATLSPITAPDLIMGPITMPGNYTGAHYSAKNQWWGLLQYLNPMVGPITLWWMTKPYDDKA